MLLIAIVYTPFLQQAFGTFSLAASDWILAATMAVSIVPVVEAVKWAGRHGWLGELV